MTLAAVSARLQCLRLRAGKGSRGIALAVLAALSAGLAAGLVCPSAVLAAEKKSSKPRSQVDDVPGDYIQLETVWVPVLDPRGKLAYLGMVVRLWPGQAEGKRYEACVAAPRVAEQLLMHFNEKPLARETYQNGKKLAAAVAAVVNEKTDAGVYSKIETFRDFVIPDENSILLSQTCR